MLADVDALRRELATQLTAAELGLHGNPENLTDPKEKLKEVIRLVNDKEKHYRERQIGELYAALGADMSLASLENLKSYRRFRDFAKEGLIAIGNLQP
ncbi:MAG: hypothetical protein WBA17_10230 [Saprospiraceae bacterium]